MNKKILFMDSGIGGLSVLKETLTLLPNENYIYYADTKNNPYGNKTVEELEIIASSIVDKYKEDVKMIVVACNTLTTTVITYLREKYKDIIFIGVEPAVKVIYDNYKDEKSLVLVTNSTKNSKRLKELMEKYPSKNMEVYGDPRLANIIENNMEEAQSYIEENLKQFQNIGLKYVVLGCTHYPFVRDKLESFLNVKCIDGNIGISNQIKRKLEEFNLLNNDKGSLELVNSLSDERISKMLEILNK